MMKTTVILQSNYIPWKGYFDLIHDADLFIFYDDLQYTKNDWRNRNKIKTKNGTEWLTIPTGIDSNRLICDVEIKNYAWQAKHWKTIEHQYGKTPYFVQYRELLQEIYLGRVWTNLSEFNQFMIRTISKDILNITTDFQDSREFELSGKKQDRLLDLIIQTGTNRYVSGPAARDYIDRSIFSESGVELIWKDYAGYPVYPQRHPPFEHGVSILDLILNTGPEAPWYIWGWREKESASPTNGK